MHMQFLTHHSHQVLTPKTDCDALVCRVCDRASQGVVKQKRIVSMVIFNSIDSASADCLRLSPPLP